MDKDLFSAKDSFGFLWGFELPKGEKPCIGVTGWLLPLSSRGRKFLLSETPTEDTEGWHHSLKVKVTAGTGEVGAQRV